MKKNIFFSIIIIFFISLIAFNGCKKARLNKLRGNWKMLNWSDNMCDNMVLNFVDDKTVYMIQNTIIDTITDTVEYVLEAGLSKTYITFTPYVGCQTVFTGKWMITNLEKNSFAMIFQESTGQTSREFEKIK